MGIEAVANYWDRRIENDLELLNLLRWVREVNYPDHSKQEIEDLFYGLRPKADLEALPLEDPNTNWPKHVLSKAFRLVQQSVDKAELNQSLEFYCNQEEPEMNPVTVQKIAKWVWNK